jgi:allophanate hydrolase subunit 1
MVKETYTFNVGDKKVYAVKDGDRVRFVPKKKKKKTK